MLSAEQVVVDFNGSRLYLTGVLVLSIAALAGLWLAGLPIALSCSMSLAVAISAYDAARRHGLRIGDDAVSRIGCTSEGWRIWLGAGQSRRADCDGDILVIRWLVVMKLVDDTGLQHAVVVLPDSTSRHAFRRLKVFLRFFNRSAVAPAAYPAQLLPGRDGQA